MDAKIDQAMGRLHALITATFPNSRYRSCALTNLELVEMYLERASFDLEKEKIKEAEILKYRHDHPDSKFAMDESGTVVAVIGG